MIFSSAAKSLRTLAEPEMRGVFWKTLGLTIAALIGAWFAISAGVTELALPFIGDVTPWNEAAWPQWTGWVSLFAAIAAGIALAAGLAFLIGPVSALIAGLFLDDAAAHIEATHYPDEPAGREMPIGEAIILSVKFAGIVILGNILAFALLLVPGINLIAFFVVNGYLLGREYFEFAARRFAGDEEVRRLRSRYSGTIFGAGMVIAGFLAIPVVNLLTPLFGAGLMVHLHKAVRQREGAGGRAAPAGEPV